MISPTAKRILFTGYGLLFLLAIAGAFFLELYWLPVLAFLLLVVPEAWQQPRNVLFLLLISIPFSTEIAVTGTLHTDFPDEGLMLLLTGLALFSTIARPSAWSTPALRHPLVGILLLFLAWSGICALFSANHLFSIKYLLAKSWYTGAFIIAPLLFIKTKRDIRIALTALTVSMLILVSITMMRHAGHGFTFAGINPSLDPFFINHVNYSALLVCILPVLAGACRLCTSPVQRGWLMVLLLLVLAAVFLSYARGAWLALFADILAWWLIRKRKLVFAYLLFITLTLAAIAWLASSDRYLRYAHDYRTTIFHENFREHLQATYAFKDVSTAERFYRWIAGARMTTEHPLLGFGPGTFYEQYKPYTIPAFKTWVSGNPEHSTVHNYFLLVTIEQGYPGLLIFLFLAGALLWYAQRLYHRVQDPFYKKLAMGTGVVLVMILTVNFLSDLIETDKVGSLFFLCISFLVITDVKTGRWSKAAADV